MANTSKEEFIKKWSTWWLFDKQRDQLTIVFEIELESIIEQAIKKRIKDVLNYLKNNDGK